MSQSRQRQRQFAARLRIPRSIFRVMLDIDDLISKQISHSFNAASSNKKKKKNPQINLWCTSGSDEQKTAPSIKLPTIPTRIKGASCFFLRFTNAGESFKIEGRLLLQQLNWRHISFTTSSIKRTQYKLIKPRLPRLVLHEGLSDVCSSVTLSCNRCGWHLWTIVWNYRSRNFVNSKALINSFSLKQLDMHSIIPLHFIP